MPTLTPKVVALPPIRLWEGGAIHSLPIQTRKSWYLVMNCMKKPTPKQLLNRLAVFARLSAQTGITVQCLAELPVPAVARIVDDLRQRGAR